MIDYTDIHKILKILEYVTEAFRQLNNGNISKAEECLKKAKEIDEDNDFVIYLEGSLYMIKGDLEKAEECFEKLSVLSNNRSIASLRNLICLSFINKKYDDTLKYAEILKKHSDSCPLVYFHKMLVYLQRYELDKALKVIDEALKKIPNKEIYLREKVRILIHYNRYDEAYECVNELIKNNPNDAYLWELKGDILKELGDIEEAIIAYVTSYNLNNNLTHILKKIGYLYLTLGDADKSLKYLSKYLKYKSLDIEAKFYLALCYEKLKEYEKALNLFDEVIESSKNKIYQKISRLYKAKIYEYLKKYDRSVEELNKAFED